MSDHEDLRFLTGPHPLLAGLLEPLPAPTGPGRRQWAILPSALPCTWCDYDASTYVVLETSRPADPAPDRDRSSLTVPGAGGYAAHVACDAEQRWDIVRNAAHQLCELLVVSGLLAGHLPFAELRFPGAGPLALHQASDLLPKHALDELVVDPAVPIRVKAVPCLRCGLPTHAEYRWEHATQGPQHFECLEAAWRGVPVETLRAELRRLGTPLRSVP